MAGDLVFIGSSSVEESSPLPRFVAERIGAESFRALGRRGSRVSQWVDWLGRNHASELDAVRGNLVCVHLGGNEPIERPPEFGAVATVDEAIRGAGALAVVWLPPPVFPRSSTDAGGRRMHGRRAQMVATLEAAGVAFVDRVVTIPDRLFAPDGVHPRIAGYRRWAEQVGAPLRERFAEQTNPDNARARFPWLLFACAAIGGVLIA